MVPPDPLLTFAECLTLGVATYPDRTASRAHAVALVVALGGSEEEAARIITLCIDQGMLHADGTRLRAS